MLRQTLRQAAVNAKQLCVAEHLHAHSSLCGMQVKATTAIDLLGVASCDIAPL